MSPSAVWSFAIGVLRVMCFAAIPQAGALLADTRQPPTPARPKGSNAAADAGTPTWLSLKQQCTTSMCICLFPTLS